MEKCEYCQDEITYLCHEVNKHVMKTDKNKVKAIIDYASRTKIKQLRRFLSTTSWYRRFIQDYSTNIAPLTKLLKKKQRWIWGPFQIAPFEMIKTLLTQAPILICPDFSKRFYFQTDGSEYGLGVALIQTDEITIKTRDKLQCYSRRTVSNSIWS